MQVSLLIAIEPRFAHTGIQICQSESIHHTRTINCNLSSHSKSPMREANMDFPCSPLWINRIGMLMDFLAFWFAAPELLGERRLKAMEKIVVESAKGCYFSLGCLMPIILWFLIIPWVDELLRPLRGAPTSKVLITGLILTSLALLLWWILSNLSFTLVKRAMRAVVHFFSDDSRTRRRALSIGAAFFVIGFILQLISTF